MTHLMEHLPVLVILFSLCGALLCPLVSWRRAAWGKRMVMTGLFLALVCAVVQLAGIIQTGEPVHYYLGGWKPPYGIEFVVDGVNGLVIVLVAAISWMTSLYSSPFERANQKKWFQTAGYYCLIAFLAVGLLGMSTTGDAFNLYVFMEITAISGYGLIAIGEEKGPIAAFRYLMTGTIGASMYLLGVGFLYAATGTLNMADLALRLVELQESPLVILSAACLIVGFGIKMALFPLHGWQPAAHSYAHPAADPMIAGIMIKVPAYGMLRFFYCVFRETSPVMDLFFDVIGILGICGILYGSLKALRYDTYNKILAFSSIGQVGYIAVGFAIGNVYGLAGAVLHILSHAFMKTGLFYTSGAVKYKYGVHVTDDFGQVYRKMPQTSLTMIICALSMIGLPPFAGFFSKWYLALGAIQNGQWYFVAVLIVSSLLSAIYFFRIIEKLFMNQATVAEGEVPHGGHEPLQKVAEAHEAFGASGPCQAFGASDSACGADGTPPARPAKSRFGGYFELPWQMMVPLVLVALAIISLGLGNAWLVGEVLKPTLMEVFLA